MRRLVPGLVLTLLLTLTVLAPTAAFAAADVETSTTTVLAAEEGGEVGGLEPGDPNAEDNTYAPSEYEGNFLWGGAVGLLVLLAIGFGAMGGLYYLLVIKANEKKASA